MGNSVRGLYGINVSFKIPKSNIFSIVGYSRQLHHGFYLYDFVLSVSYILDSDRTTVNRTFENFSSGGAFSINIGYLFDPFNFADGLITSFLYKNIHTKHVDPHRELLPRDYWGDYSYGDVQNYLETTQRHFFNLSILNRRIRKNNFFTSIGVEAGVVLTTIAHERDINVRKIKYPQEIYKPYKKFTGNGNINFSIGYFIK